MTWLVSVIAVAAPSLLWAQDTTRAGVRIGITYAPGSRPAVAVVRTAGGAFLDSVRLILERDLEQSDRFEIVAPAGRGETGDPAAILRSRAADLMVQVDADGDGARVAAIDVVTGRRVHERRLAAAPLSRGEGRHALHRLADDIVRVVTGAPGAAATRLLFVRQGRLMIVDADGHQPRQFRSAGRPALSPAWSPDGVRVAYTAYVPAGQPIVLQNVASGARTVVPTTERGLNITPAFSPDGRRLAWAHGTEAGTDVYVYDVGRGCCVQRLTVGRGFADNLSPAWSPDGTRIAFVSTRAGSPQLYVMSADGSGQEVLARFDYGATGATSGPDWSPDGGAIAFHRDVGGVPQVFVLDLATRAVRQLTGSGRNEDPTWAPDGRHLAFVSDRGGSRELWVVDLETGRLRQLTSVGGARLPAWSPRISADGGRE
jgi:TolB protein